MKKIYLFSTRLVYFWSLAPLFVLLGFSIANNNEKAGVLRLYPLIFLTVAAIIFICIYLFRAVRLSYDEIRHIGRFSKREVAEINEGKILILERIRGNRLQITLFGNDGVLPEFDWMKTTGDIPRDIPLFRARAIWYRYSTIKMLRYFGLTKDECLKVMNGDITEITNNIVTVTYEYENDAIIKIKVNKTV